MEYTIPLLHILPFRSMKLKFCSVREYENKCDGKRRNKIKIIIKNKNKNKTAKNTILSKNSKSQSKNSGKRQRRNQRHQRYKNTQIHDSSLS